MITGDKVWFDGSLATSKSISVSLMSHGLHYGGGVFEGIRIYDTPRGRSIFRLRDHLCRFIDSAKYLRLNIEYDIDDLYEAVKLVVRANGPNADYIRPIAFYGETPNLSMNPLNIPSHVAIITVHMGSYIGNRQVQDGMDVIISSWEKSSNRTTSSMAKICGNYINLALAKLEATQAGVDEAIMINCNGTVAEGTGENLFIVRNGNVITPDLASGILEGITRDTVMRLAKASDYIVEERPIIRGELMVADEIFMTGTAAEIVPVRTINNVLVADGAPGPVTRHMQKLFHDVVRGRDARFIEWIDLIDDKSAEISDSLETFETES
ncbi:MAG: branched-chain amino acid transaminase [Euryarchaeota archaeon]|nr:branched-chain amino acid transaminase [Euryarchaeota archaeon]